MDRKEARSPFVLTLYSYHPLDSRRISSDTTEHSDTRARLNLIKPDKFSNSGRAASILIRAMNINSRRWLTWTLWTFDHIPLVSFFSLPQPKIEHFLARDLVSFRFLHADSHSSRGGWKLDPSFIFLLLLFLSLSLFLLSFLFPYRIR